MSGPQPLSDIIPGIIKKMGLSQRVKEAEVVKEWPEMVGKAIAKHCQPVSLEKGVLTVYVDSSPWLNELQRFSKMMILEKLQSKLGKKAVKDIRFRIGEV